MSSRRFTGSRRGEPRLFRFWNAASHFVGEVEQERGVQIALLLIGGLQVRKDREALAVGMQIVEAIATAAIDLFVGPQPWLGVGEGIALGNILRDHDSVFQSGVKELASVM